MADKLEDMESCPYIYLTLVRHGETPENKNNIFQGHLDTILSEEGIRQASLVGIRLKDEKFSHVFSSDLTRARMTAEAIVSRSNCCSQIKVREDSRLKERGYGVIEGCSRSQFFQMAAKENVKPSNFVPEGAETLGEVSQRVVECFNAIISEVGNTCAGPSTTEEEGNQKPKNGFVLGNETVNEDCKNCCIGNLLLVSHGGVLRQLFNHFFVELESEFLVESRDISMVSPNTGVSKFKIFLNEETKLPKYVKCICLHDIGHLKEAQ